jgi:chromosome partitioning protein
MSGCKTIGFINQKGGIGKTTSSNATAWNLARVLKKKTLLIDFDTQASQTSVMFGMDSKEFEKDSIHNIASLFDNEIPKPLEVDDTDSLLHFLPANKELTIKSESQIIGKEKRLYKYLQKIKDDYDYIVIDSGPSFSSLMANVIIASDILVVPVGTSSLDEGGTKDFLDIVEEILSIYEKELCAFYVLPTKYNASRNDDKEVLAIIKNELPIYVQNLEELSKVKKFEILETIPERSVFKNAVSVRMNIVDYITEYDSGKKEILMTLKKIVKKIIKK